MLRVSGFPNGSCWKMLRRRVRTAKRLNHCIEMSDQKLREVSVSELLEPEEGQNRLTRWSWPG